MDKDQILDYFNNILVETAENLVKEDVNSALKSVYEAIALIKTEKGIENG